MAEPTNYLQQLISRAAGYCVGKDSKLLIVAHGATAEEIKHAIKYLQLNNIVEVLDVAVREASSETILTVDPRIAAVLVSCVNLPTMKAANNLCSNYRTMGIPVVVITGWPPPTDSRQFQTAIMNSGNLSVPDMFDLAAAYCVGGVQGDILEFGTFQGYTLQCAYHAFDRRNMVRSRRFIALDSFSGIMGAKKSEQFEDGQFSTSVESLAFSNFLAGVPQDKIVVISGTYDMTLSEQVNKTRELLGPTKAALVHIDCDIEAPAKLALDFVTPYLQQGSLLLFDEFDLNRADNTKGERAALEAWLKENSEFDVEPYRCYHTHARSFIVHRH